MIRSLTLALAAVLFGTGVADAANITADPQAIASTLTARGYRAEVSKDDQGDPLIKSASSGSTFAILFFGCTNGRACKTVQFYAGYSRKGAVSMGKINDWNKSKRFGRAYLDSDNDPVIEMDVDLDDGGVSPALFEDNLEFWVTLMGSFEKHIAS